MVDAKTAAAPLGYLRIDDHCVREARWRLEGDPQIDHRNPHDLIGFEHLPLGQAGLFEQCGRACVEIRQVARVVDNLRWITIAPLDVNRFPVRDVRLLAQ